MLTVLVCGLALSGCGGPAPVDSVQQQATRGSVIDLLELRRFAGPDQEQRDETPMMIDDDTRSSMQTLPGAPWSVSLVLPQAVPGSDNPSVLRFALGIPFQGWEDGGHPVRFRVHARGRRSLFKRTLFDRTLDPGGDVNHRTWQDEEVDLARYAGQRVELIFSTENVGGGEVDTGAFAVWAHPLILGPAPSSTNVLVILVDTLRADHLGANGYDGRATPHLDRWAGRGVFFQQVVSSSCWTAPAVASLFTGQHPYRHGVRTKYALELREGADTLAERFRRGGWFTGAISDNLLIIPDNGYDQGFHTFLTHPWNRRERGARGVTDQALAWLERNGGHPFFLYLHYMDPHGSYKPEEPFKPPPPGMPGEIRELVERGDCGGVTKEIRKDSSFRLTEVEQQRLLDLYDGEIAAADFHIARIFALLEREGLLDRTVVVFLADHGEGFGEHNVYSHAHTLHDEEVLVPLVILPPPGMNLARGLRHSGVVRMVDLAPTLLDLCGQAAEDEMAGRSLVQVMAGEPLPAVNIEAYSEKAPYARPDANLQVVSAVRSPAMKLIFHPGRRDYRLYDLLADPREQQDIFTPGDRLAAKMMARLNHYLDDAEKSPLAGADIGEGPDAAQLERLQALGYLE